MSTPAPHEPARTSAHLRLRAVPRRPGRTALVRAVTALTAAAGVALAVAGGLLALGMVSAGPGAAAPYREAGLAVRQPADSRTVVRAQLRGPQAQGLRVRVHTAPTLTHRDGRLPARLG